jgi:hypothetical protein
LHFADDLKDIAKKYFNWNGLKDTINRQVLIDVGQVARGEIQDGLIYKKFKELKSILGTPEKNYWVNRVLIKVSNLHNITIKDTGYDDIFIIPDTRFKNEINLFIDRYKNLVYTLRINPNERSLNINDISETDLDDYIFNYYINNNSNYEDLQKNIEQLLDTFVK